MAKIHKPRGGSLQFRPRTRAAKILSSINWKPLENSDTNKKLLGFIGYKVGMASALVKDNTPDSLTKNKKIILPVTILECPPLKILAVRFYKYDNTALDVYSSNLDKNLKRKLNVPKSQKNSLEEISKNLSNYTNIRILVYTDVIKTNLKKTPDVLELGIKGNIEEKLNFVKNFVGKEIALNDVFEKTDIVDIHGVTKGKGFTGSIKRFGISLKGHKTEKGIRRPGSLGPWVPRRVTFKAPQAGQLGYFSRPSYNNKIVDLGKISEKDINKQGGFKHYGIIKTDYILIKGSVPGPQKRPILLASVLRPSKKKSKQNFELIKLE